MSFFHGTPSWDDEQVAKYGFFNHMKMVAELDTAAMLQDRREELLRQLQNLYCHNRSPQNT
jgi:hypothetical protein